MILITWNIQYGKGADGRIDFPRIVEIARKLGDADVICFQELAVNFPDIDGGAGPTGHVRGARAERFADRVGMPAKEHAGTHGYREPFVRIARDRVRGGVRPPGARGVSAAADPCDEQGTARHHG